MCWVLFMKYHLMIKQRRQDAIVSVNQPLSRQPNGTVPWLVLLKNPAFWCDLVNCLYILLLFSIRFDYIDYEYFYIGIMPHIFSIFLIDYYLSHLKNHI